MTRFFIGFAEMCVWVFVFAFVAGVIQYLGARDLLAGAVAAIVASWATETYRDVINRHDS